MENINKTAIVVGASSGIGQATARLLKKNGYSVTNISRSMPDCGTDTVLADASVRGNIKAAIDEATANLGLDVLVYSAGYSMASPIEYADSADYRYLFEVNFFGILEAMQAAIPHLKQNGGGRIVLISSLAGTLPVAFDAFYSASKAAVDMIADAADIELKPYNIRVCAVRPGGVATKFTFKRNIYSDDKVKEYAHKQARAVASLAAMEQGGLNPDKVAETVLSVINMQNPPTRLAVGLRNKAISSAARILPARVVEYFNSNVYDQ